MKILVHLSGISLWKAVHNTNTNNWEFSDIGTQFHPDNHAFAFDTKNPEIIYAGSDGGVYRSEDGGKNWDDSINDGLCITQFEFMEQNPTNEKRLIAVTQDNGTERYDGNPQFYHGHDGDGGFVCIDPNQPQNVWHTFYDLSPVFSSLYRFRKNHIKQNHEYCKIEGDQIKYALWKQIRQDRWLEGLLTKWYPQSGYFLALNCCQQSEDTLKYNLL